MHGDNCEANLITFDSYLSSTSIASSSSSIHVSLGALKLELKFLPTLRPYFDFTLQFLAHCGYYT